MYDGKVNGKARVQKGTVGGFACGDVYCHPRWLLLSIVDVYQVSINHLSGEIQGGRTSVGTQPQTVSFEPTVTYQEKETIVFNLFPESISSMTSSPAYFSEATQAYMVAVV